MLLCVAGRSLRRARWRRPNCRIAALVRGGAAGADGIPAATKADKAAFAGDGGSSHHTRCNRSGRFGCAGRLGFLAGTLSASRRQTASPARIECRCRRLGRWRPARPRSASVGGEVTGEVAPPIFVGGGYWRPTAARPVAVEGIGYAILPEIEGEAHGLVGVAGIGAASQSRGLVGAGAGAVGVDGRSAARLSIKAAAIGDRGLAGSGAGVITLKGAAVGRHDDDEAAMIALLLAA